MDDDGNRRSDPPASIPDPGAAPSVPTCYRHLDRETYIRCTRCERPICPDCMTAASVGFQCPECVQKGQAAVRQGRTVFGGRIAEGAVVTKTLIGLNVLAFIAQYVVGLSQSVERFALLGYASNVQGEVIGVAAGEYYRLLTAAFLHGGLLHIAFNMWVLYALGPQLEAALGRIRFITLYLVSAIGGSVVSYMFSQPNSPSVGASGAIFGLMGATLVLGHAMRQEVTSVLVFIGINIAIGFVVPKIDWRAHLGGLLVGAAVAALFAYGPRLVGAGSGDLRSGMAVVADTAAARAIVIGGIVLIVVVLAGLVVFRSNQLTGF